MIGTGAPSLHDRNFYIAKKMFSPDTLQGAQNMEIPFDAFKARWASCDGSHLPISYYNPLDLPLSPNFSSSDSAPVGFTDTSSSSSTTSSVSPQTYNEYPKPVWQPDSESSNCASCKKSFSLFTRKHHCRVCGHIFCSTCVRDYPVQNLRFSCADYILNKSDRTAVLPGNFTNDKILICQECFEARAT